LKGLVPDDVHRAVVSPRKRAQAQWQALRRKGLRAWWRTRRLHRWCAELAFKRMQARLRPDETEIAKEADRLYERVKTLLAQKSCRVDGGVL
jgi:hypothetical protein